MAAPPGGAAAREDLTADDARWAAREVMDDACAPVKQAAFLVALRAKGSTVGHPAMSMPARIGELRKTVKGISRPGRRRSVHPGGAVPVNVLFSGAARASPAPAA